MSDNKRRKVFTPEFKRRLIELIEKQPLLYETPRLRERLAEREMIWEDIGRKLNRSVAECKSAWKYLRRRYIPYLTSNSYEKRGPSSRSASERLEFVFPYREEEEPLSPASAASSSTNILMMNEEALSTTPMVMKTSTNSTITTDGAMPKVTQPIDVSRPGVSTISTAPTSLSSKISKTEKVSRLSSTTSTSMTISRSKATSESTAINNSIPRTSSLDIKENPLIFVPSYTQKKKSENLNTFFVTQDVIQQLLESKEKDEKQSDFTDDNKCITIDEGFIENPYNNQMQTKLSSDSCEINRNNVATEKRIGEGNFLAENLTSSAQTMRGEMEKQGIDSIHIEPADNNDFNMRLKNYFLCMADRLTGLPQYVQEGICLNISEIIDQARIKHLSD